MTALGIPSYQPAVMGTRHMVVANNYLAAQAGYRILEEGGNAVDAGVATGLAINVTMPQMTNLGGVAPIIMYLADSDEVLTVSGLGRWPKSATLEAHRERFGDDIPQGMASIVTPAAADAWLTALERYGTMSFEQVVAPALDLAENGFPNTLSILRMAQRFEDFLHDWPANGDIFMPGGEHRQVGDVFVQSDLAATLRRMIDVERANGDGGRKEAVRAVRDYFYKGEIAEEMARFCGEHGGFLTLDDLRDFHVKIEAPERGSYKGIDVYTCGFWCQGPALIQVLQILEGMDVGSMGHNSADYLHAVLESIKLALSDRHSYYGDPEFVDVPQALMSGAYAEVRRDLIDMTKAWPEMPPPGDPRALKATTNGVLSAPALAPVDGSREDEGGTAYFCVVDQWGNAFSSTPSDLTVHTPIVPGLGVGISPRGSQAWLDPEHPSCLAPGKRPRLTPNPSLAMKDGKVFMTFGTPGVDAQVQTMVQAFLNIVEFGMDAQQAVEEPRVVSLSHPDTGWPHPYQPAAVRAESRIPEDTLAELERRGHKIQRQADFMQMGGALCIITVDHERGLLVGGADPRLESAAVGR